MGNVSNPAQWATRERLRFIERSAFWRGVVNRQDLAETFGLSMAQASADLQKYQEMNPGALIYNLKRKRYEGAREFAPVCHEPRLEEAMALFLEDGERAAGVMDVGRGWRSRGGGAQVEILTTPARRVALSVARRVFLAVVEGHRVRVKYFSVHGSRAERRWLRPHAFAHDGNRWHVRAWSEENSEYRNFTLARMTEAEWPVAGEPLTTRDAPWREEVTLTFEASRELDALQRKAVETEYGMKKGRLKVTVRRALEDYLRDRLHVTLSDGHIPVRPLRLVAREPEMGSGGHQRPTRGRQRSR